MNRISALILDWAGTTVDFGSFAPTQIFVEAFRQAFDIEITLEEARVPMGLASGSTLRRWANSLLSIAAGRPNRPRDDGRRYRCDLRRVYAAANR
ncbi:phosphonoacetaldehyde hydrolase [Klebsiella pneumoniae]|uniref:Phosphonoacetaldehyde hydrolase n=1 Tax=Klebsiella pneumoniae TaxID=573 RepID=A0A377TLH3_KLEPN|nr:phosphonoacetaldehyde hydrolase [Klebsiella pneumoniae]